MDKKVQAYQAYLTAYRQVDNEKLYGIATTIVEDKELSWEEKYYLIFSKDISGRVYGQFEWLDMDTSYEEDVRNFMSGFEEYVKKD